MQTTPTRDQHKPEVLAFLRRELTGQRWEIWLPPSGTGHETYLARSDGGAFFIKLGAEPERYRLMSELGLSPPVVAAGFLTDGTSILVQQQISGHRPSRRDFHLHLRKFAQGLRDTHNHEKLQQILPGRGSDSYKTVGFKVLEDVVQRWEKYKTQVPASAGYVDEKIQVLWDQVNQFEGHGLVASHNDVCNGNWLVSTQGTIYLLDYESMSLDDPAQDLGAILWWYYPPGMRRKFLEIAGYRHEAALRERMRVRMAIHNLNIILPRHQSYDRFNAGSFEESLVDFRAVVEGKENPQGYTGEASW